MVQGTFESHSFASATLGRDYRYTVYRPPAFDADAPYPTLYLLHGRGDSMGAWREAGPVLDQLIASGRMPAVIAVMPDAPAQSRAGYYVDSGYTGTDEKALPAELTETAFFADLIPHIEVHFPVVRHRSGRAIGGYSMGGYGALRYLLAHADLFSAGIILSPAVYTPLPPTESSAREFGAFGSGQRLFDAETYESLNYPALLDDYSGGRHPVHAFIAVGDDEWKHPDPEDALHDLDMEAHLFYNRLSRRHGVNAEFRVYDGGHDWGVWRRGLEEGLVYMANHLRLSRYR